VTTAALMAIALPTIDLPATAAGLGAFAEASTASQAGLTTPASSSGFVKLTSATALSNVESKQGLGRACEVAKLAEKTWVAACEVPLRSWAANTPRWVRVHHWTGGWLEPRSRPPVVRAAVGPLGPGVVLEAVPESPVASLAGKLVWLLLLLASVAGLGVLLARRSS